MQNHRLPSFFLTNTTALHQALWLGLIVPDSSISCRWFWTSSTSSRGICLNHSLKRVSSVTFIICLVEWVQANSVGSNENTCHGTQPGAGGQHQPAPGAKNTTHSNPVHWIISHAFAWQSIWGYKDSGACQPPPATELTQVVWAPGVLLLPWPLGFSFGGSAGKLYCSLPPWLPFYFLASTMCVCFVQWGLVAKSHLWSTRLGPWC